MAQKDPFKALRPFTAGGQSGSLYSLPALEQAGLGKVSRLPVSIRLVLESVLRTSGAMTSRLDGMERAGLIRRIQNPGDRRSVLVELTQRGRTLAEAAAPYLSQLGLYAGALARATGRVPTASLAFLRTGEHYTPPRADLETALAGARAAIDGGALRAALSAARRDILSGNPSRLEGLRERLRSFDPAGLLDPGARHRFAHTAVDK